MPDVLVIGGGVIGLLTARELRLAGADVVLLERGEPGRESSWAGGGIVSPLYPWRYADAVNALARWSQRHYPDLCAALEETTGIEPEFEQSGLLIDASGEEALATEWAARHDVRLEAVARDEIGDLEPGLRDPPAGALWLPEIAHVRNPRLLKALRADVVARGVRVLEGHPLTGWRCDPASDPLSDSVGRSAPGTWPRRPDDGPGDHRARVMAVDTPHGTVAADTFIICAGSWSGDLLAPLGVRPDIHPVKGQMILFRAAAGTVRTIHLTADRYAIPRRDGRVLFGSTLEETGFEKEATATAREELWRIATTRFPALRDAAVERHWAGLRPASPSGIPYIGRHPTLANLFVNAGHFRNGIVLGPASARLMADLVLGRPPVVDPAPYGLDTPRP
jgi:glycine oxidase